MQKAIIEDSWLRGARRTGFSVVAAALALVAGFLLAAWVASTFIALFARGAASSPGLLVLWIPWLLWLGFLARSAAAKDSWVGAAKRTGFLVTATAAAIAAGVFLVASIVAALIIAYDGGSLLWLLIPLSLFAVTAASTVWLARHARISRLPWFLIGAGAFSTAWMAGLALIWFGGGD